MGHSLALGPAFISISAYLEDDRVSLFGASMALGRGFGGGLVVYIFEIPERVEDMNDDTIRTLSFTFLGASSEVWDVLPRFFEIFRISFLAGITCSTPNFHLVSKGVKHVLPFKTIIPLPWPSNPSPDPQTPFANSPSTPAPSGLQPRNKSPS